MIVADILFQVMTPFKRLFSINVSSRFQQKCICGRCVCVHCAGMSLHVYICLCCCVHIAAPMRGRLFHLIEGQYLHEESHRHLSRFFTQNTSLPLYFNKVFVPVIFSSPARCQSSRKISSLLFSVYDLSGGDAHWLFVQQITFTQRLRLPP